MQLGTDGKVKLIGQVPLFSQLSKKARDKKLQPADMEGGTFTITNLGGIGGTGFSPIVNYPEVGILGVHRIAPRPVVREGEVVVRQMGNVSVTFDHRVVDGARGAEFLDTLSGLVEEPAGLVA